MLSNPFVLCANPPQFAAYFHNAPVVNIPGTNYYFVYAQSTNDYMLTETWDSVLTTRRLYAPSQ